MADHHPGRLPPGLPTRDRKRERHADEKRKRRLDKIVQRAPDPLDMRLLRSEESPNPALGQGLRHTLQPQHLRHHQEHDKAAVSIEGSEPRRRTDRRIINGGRRQRGGHALDLSRIASAVAKTNLGPNRGALSHAPTATSASPPVPTAGKPPLPSSRTAPAPTPTDRSHRVAPRPHPRTAPTPHLQSPHRTACSRSRSLIGQQIPIGKSQSKIENQPSKIFRGCSGFYPWLECAAACRELWVSR